MYENLILFTNDIHELYRIENEIVKITVGYSVYRIALGQISSVRKKKDYTWIEYKL